MLAVGFAALLGLVLGRFFKVAILAPGVTATTAFAMLVEGASGAGAASMLTAAILAACCLQFGYLVGSSTAHSARRSRLSAPPDAFEPPLSKTRRAAQ
jgi:hypothetical protein